MRVRYIYSACVVIDTPDTRILCDPWFTPGAYDGSWVQWPEVRSPIDKIGPVDLIYVSHIHPDHYDPIFIREYLGCFPAATIVIGRQTPPILERKLSADGFSFKAIDELRVGKTDISILPNGSRAVNIDTALLVRRDGQSIVNLNDNPIDVQQLSRIRELCGGSITLALLPYGGATAHPQTFIFPSKHDLATAAEAKERHFLDIFHRYIEELNPAMTLPFAGKYWLAGPLRALNPDRGIPDPVKAAAEAKGRAIVLADGGEAYFDLDTMTASATRTTPYEPAEVDAYLAALDFQGYAYEREIRPDPGHALPLLPLLNSALRNARRRSPISVSCWVCLRTGKAETVFCFDVATSDDAITLTDPQQINALLPRLEIYIDERYLFGLLSRLYHWNNALIGSHYRCRRTPDVFRREVSDFFDYLQA